MSSEVFPSDLPGIKLDVERAPRYSTGIQEATSGQEYRALWFNRPRTRMRYNVEVLRSSYPTEWQELVSFYQRHGGRYDSFLYTSPDDATIPADEPMVFGIGDGATTEFQLQRALSPDFRLRSNCLYTFTVGDVAALAGVTFTRASSATYFDRYGVMRTAGTNVARVVYFDDEPHWLIEGQAVNLCLRSQEFDNATWTKTNAGAGSVPVVTANAAVAPDGTLTADRVTFDAPGSGDRSSLAQASIPTVALSSYTGSLYVKASSALDVGKVLLYRNVAASAYTSVTLTAEWQRIQATEVAAGVSSSIAIDLRPGFGSSSTGTVTALLWGSQLELGTIASSYIATTTVAVTRSADAWYITAPSVRTMSIWFEGVDMGTADVPGARYWQISNSAGGDAYWGVYTDTGLSSTSAGYRVAAFPPVAAESTVAGAVALLDRVRLLATMDSTGSTVLTRSLNGAAAVAGAASAPPLNLDVAWSQNRLTINGPVTAGAIALRRLLIVAGVQTFDDMEAYAEESSAPVAFYPEFTDGYEPIAAINGLPVIYADGLELIPGIDWTVTDAGVVTFTTAPAAGIRLGWSGSYYWRMRFDSDAWATRRIVRDLWEAPTLELVQVV